MSNGNGNTDGRHRVDTSALRAQWDQFHAAHPQVTKRDVSLRAGVPHHSLSCTLREPRSAQDRVAALTEAMVRWDDAPAAPPQDNDDALLGARIAAAAAAGRREVMRKLVEHLTAEYGPKVVGNVLNDQVDLPCLPALEVCPAGAEEYHCQQSCECPKVNCPACVDYEHGMGFCALMVVVAALDGQSEAPLQRHLPHAPAVLGRLYDVFLDCAAAADTLKTTLEEAWARDPSTGGKG